MSAWRRRAKWFRELEKEKAEEMLTRHYQQELSNENSCRRLANTVKGKVKARGKRMWRGCLGASGRILLSNSI